MRAPDDRNAERLEVSRARQLIVRGLADRLDGRLVAGDLHRLADLETVERQHRREPDRLHAGNRRQRRFGAAEERQDARLIRVAAERQAHGHRHHRIGVVAGIRRVHRRQRAHEQARRRRAAAPRPRLRRPRACSATARRRRSTRVRRRSAIRRAASAPHATRAPCRRARRSGRSALSRRA